ncbi:hypothetical protein BKA16_004762 [Gordonia humi]|uniref:DUF112 domain-containing protein n=1 Tax=Gordonia humi TaxID=686429 RepID=A0A840FFB2_9ACTN|nr:hypothetical protein [Gordonia humi]
MPTTLLGIPGDTMAIALMEEAAHLRALGVPHVALRKMISAAFLAALLAVPIAVLCAALLAKVSDPLREAIPYVFPAVAVGIAYLSRGRWASVLALVPLTAMIVGLNSFVDQQIDKTLSISFFVGLAVGPMVVDLVGLISPLTRSKLPTRSRPVFTIAPEPTSAIGGRSLARLNPFRSLTRSEAGLTASSAAVTSLTFFVSPLAMAVLVGEIVSARAKQAYVRLSRTIAVRNGVTDSTYLAETLIPLVAIDLPLSPIAAGAAAPLFNAPPVYTVGGDGVDLHNLHSLLTAPEFLVFAMIGVLAAGAIAFPLTMRYARPAAVWVARHLSHEAVIGAFVGLVLVVSLYEGGAYGILVLLSVGLIGGLLNKTIGMHAGVQCMAYYIAVLSVPAFLG